MQVEWLIFFYIGVSVAMALFDLAFAAFESTRDRGFKRRTQRMAVMLGEEIERNADFPTPEHKRVLLRRMKRLSGMESFDLTMDKFIALDSAKAERYLLGISDVFEGLAAAYSQRKPLNQAYYAYVVRRWYRQRPASPHIVHEMLRYMEEGTVFLRQNALEAVASFGDAALMVRAVRILDEQGSFHHPKLITETILAFSGDRDVLADELASCLDRFSPAAQAAIINFLRMRHRGNKDWLFGALCDAGCDQEVRLACVRYFMTNPLEAAAAPLREMAGSRKPGEWELASVAASALASYPGQETVAVLKGMLSSPIWYVRFNAAKSLYGLGLSIDGDLADVMAGDDRYAKEMLLYRWRLEEGEVA